MIDFTNNVDILLSSPTEGPEVRRRKRQERQAVMEDKIRDIKRKQRDAEEAPKKRRSFMISIAAGVVVVVGLVCVYAYVKFG